MVGRDGCCCVPRHGRSSRLLPLLKVSQMDKCIPLVRESSVYTSAAQGEGHKVPRTIWYEICEMNDSADGEEYGEDESRSSVGIVWIEIEVCFAFCARVDGRDIHAGSSERKY